MHRIFLRIPESVDFKKLKNHIERRMEPKCKRTAVSFNDLFFEKIAQFAKSNKIALSSMLQFLIMEALILEIKVLEDKLIEEEDKLKEKEYELKEKEYEICGLVHKLAEAVNTYTEMIRQTSSFKYGEKEKALENLRAEVISLEIKLKSNRKIVNDWVNKLINEGKIKDGEKPKLGLI